MNSLINLTESLNDFQTLFSKDSILRTSIIIVGALTVAYLASKYLAKIIIRLIQIVSTHSDKETNDEKLIRLRQIETYLSVTIAIVRVVVVSIVIYVTWLLLTNGRTSSTNGLATIGASAFFIVFAGQSLGSILRDITAGSAMIIEQLV